MIRNSKSINREKESNSRWWKWVLQSLVVLILIGILWLFKILPGWIIERELEKQLALLPKQEIENKIETPSPSADKETENRPGSIIPAEEIISVLRTIKDPEIDINLVDLGLIRDVTSDADGVSIKMILTSRFCPHQGSLVESVKEAARRAAGHDRIDVAIDYSVTWRYEDLTPEGKKQWQKVFGDENTAQAESIN